MLLINDAGTVGAAPDVANLFKRCYVFVWEPVD